MSQKVLVVEQSATARHVLESQVKLTGLEVESVGSYKEAIASLQQQYQSFSHGEYACLVFSWSKDDPQKLIEFCQYLEKVDYHDLPVIVLSQSSKVSVRTWVGARANTTLIKRRDYQEIPGLLGQLIDIEPKVNEADTEGQIDDVFVNKFSNADINILVVDDSPSIRFALNDLLLKNGYLVTAVGSSEEAEEQILEHTYDIAVVDYFLEGDKTGDVLVKRLLQIKPDGNLACAVLTGNYADYLIQRSLRAGAMECMFKNESSELLLARIDAIARMQRQQKQLVLERKRLTQMLSSTQQGLVYLDPQGHITLLNQTALKLLGYTDQGRAIQGLKVEDALVKQWRHLSDDTNPAIQYGVGDIITSEGGILEAQLRWQRFDAGEASLSFEPQTEPQTDKPVEQISEQDDAKQLVLANKLQKQQEPFPLMPTVLSESLDYYINAAVNSPYEFSLLSLQVLSATRQGKPLPVNYTPTLKRAVQRGLQRLVPLDRLWFDERSRTFMIVLSHNTLEDAVFQAKRIIYNIAQMARDSKQISLYSHAALLPLHRGFANNHNEIQLFSEQYLQKAVDVAYNTVYVVESQVAVSVPLARTA